ncbi:MAG: hypothetical protein KIT84_39400 [Labilithrix sp.]|nr:hypothetical protein [Labilithrix sp.]MCW5817129.1 hypothetical protein [Labilithrix sp.]
MALAVAGAACGDDDAPAPVADAGADVTPPAPTSTTTATGGSGGPPSPAPIPVDCALGTTVETEANDTPAEANKVNGLAFCGTISPGADVDYATFETPAGKKLTVFQAVIEGQVDFDLLVNDKTLKATDVKSFEAGAYVVKVFTKDAKPGKYRFRIQFEP